MGLLDMATSLTKAAVGVVVLPVDAAADVITMGGMLSNKEKSYTVERIQQIMKNIDDVVEP